MIGVIPRRAQVLDRGGLSDWPDSSSKTIQPPRTAAVLLSGPRSGSSIPWLLFIRSAGRKPAGSRQEAGRSRVDELKASGEPFRISKQEVWDASCRLA
jgi:hypothetical protein